MLALAEASHGRRLPGIHQQLESTNAFESNDLTFPQRFASAFDRAVELWARKPDRHWAADGSGDLAGFSYSSRPMGQSTKSRMVVLGRSSSNVDDDGVARAAVGAVGEGLFEPAIRGIKKFRISRLSPVFVL
jgi:hypothetical protein